MQDTHGVANRLKRSSREGSFISLDKSKSAIAG